MIKVMIADDHAIVRTGLRSLIHSESDHGIGRRGDAVVTRRSI